MRCSPRSNRTEAVRLIRRNFEKWDLNGDGKVAESEFWKNIQDSSITGDDAAALKTLYSYQNKLHSKLKQKSLPSLTERRLKMIENDPHIQVKFQKNFEKAKDKLKRSSDTVFTQRGKLRPEAIEQGSTIQCGFLSTLYSKVKSDPEAVKRMITATEQGYSVKFPGVVHTFEFAPLTDTEKILYSNAKENGQWLCVLEKAWGQWQSKKPHGAFIDWTDPKDATRALSQRNAIRTRVPGSSLAEVGTTPAFLRAPARSVAAGGAVIARVPRGETQLKGLKDWHYYTVTQWDAQTHTISLRNPHGKNEPVDADGKARDGKNDGHFSLSLEEFMTDFSDLTREELS